MFQSVKSIIFDNHIAPVVSYRQIQNPTVRKWFTALLCDEGDYRHSVQSTSGLRPVSDLLGLVGKSTAYSWCWGAIQDLWFWCQRCTEQGQCVNFNRSGASQLVWCVLSSSRCELDMCVSACVYRICLTFQCMLLPTLQSFWITWDRHVGMFPQPKTQLICFALTFIQLIRTIVTRQATVKKLKMSVT